MNATENSNLGPIGYSIQFFLFFALAILQTACYTSTTCAVAQTEENGKAKNNPGQIKLHRKAIRDKSNGNLKSHTIFVPEGWKMDGATQWPHPNFFRMLPSPRIVVSSPDGYVATIHHTGVYSDPRPSRAYMDTYGIRRPAENSSDGGNLVMYRPDSFRGWKTLFREVVIPEQHPDATNIRVDKVSEIDQFSSVLKKRGAAQIDQVKRANQQARSIGIAELQTIKIQGLLIEASFEKDRKKCEFIALIGLHSIETKMQGFTQIRWSVEPNVSYVGPKGKLESKLPLLSAITGSMRPTKPWMRTVQRYVAMTTPRGTPTTNVSQTKLANTYSDILDISHKGFRSRSSLSDTSQQKYVNSVHEINPYTYRDTTYQLPAGFEHVYTDNFDTIILTNDALFDPSVDLNGSGSWNKMTSR